MSWVPILKGLIFGVKTVKMMEIFKNLLLYSWAYGRQNEYIVIMSMEVFTKIVNFMTPGGRGSSDRV